MNEIRENLAVLEYLMANINKKYAPEEYGQGKEFQTLWTDNVNTLKAIRQALNDSDPQRLIQTMKNLKPAYVKLFVKFG